MFQFRKFQREDLARMALHPGVICGWATGLGKTIAMFVWPLLKVGYFPFKPLRPRAAVLLVAPGDLHRQIGDESETHFGCRPVQLDGQAAFLRLSTQNPATGRRTLSPNYYITSYTQLASNGVQPFPAFKYTEWEAAMEFLHLTAASVKAFYAKRGELFADAYERLGVSPEASAVAIRKAWFTLKQDASTAIEREVDEAYDTVKVFAPEGKGSKKGFAGLDEKQREGITRLLIERTYNEYKGGIGEFKECGGYRIKCIYSPSLADYCQDCFEAMVVDEGVKIKGEDTLVGIGARQMNPRFRKVMSATPIKNRLPDVFHLSSWVAGLLSQASARWPYAPEDREAFADEFLIAERNLTKEEKSESNRRYVKLTPQVCNVHRLWKLFAPIILRRRKEDCGEDIVPKIRNVVRVPMGARQADVYRYHLMAEYRDCNGRKAVGAQLQALRMVAANPASSLLKMVRLPDHAPVLPHVSNRAYIPKVASALQLVRQVMERDEQVVLFSAFHDSLDALSIRLREAGVPHFVLDGRVSQTRRGRLAAQFKKGNASGIPVMLAGVECMAEGHSFHLCNNVVLMAYSWAYDKFEQAINRVHRLNSPKPVNVYSIVCEGSIDRKLEALIKEKGDACELVLDGHLLGEASAEVNLAELLEIAREEFNSKEGSAKYIDEHQLDKEWPKLRASLSVAARAWGNAIRSAVMDMDVPSLATPVQRFDPTQGVIVSAQAPAIISVAERPYVEGFDDLPLWVQTLQPRKK